MIDTITQANYEYLSHARDEIFELFCEIRDKFDGSEYMQGKKDGLRTALALLGMDGMQNFNRGGPMENPPPMPAETAENR